MNACKPISRATAGAFHRRVLPATLAVLLSGSASATPTSAWDQLKADPRTAQADSMTALERWNLAREYGLESFLPGPNATTRYYTNCNDAGAGSLRAAVASAVSGDVVAPDNLACSTISLTTGAIAIGADDLTIMGPGRHKLTVRNGAQEGRVFRHTGEGTLTLGDMAIADGRVSQNAAGDPAARGGCINSNGIVNLGSPFALAPDTAHGVIVRNCVATTTVANGWVEAGGIYAERGLTLNASTISGCRAIAQAQAINVSAGGVFARGTFVMKYSEIRDNHAEGSNSHAGGASVVMYGATATITRSTIAGNSAERSAGIGMSGPYTTLVRIESSTISGNTSTEDSSGASLFTYGDIKVLSSTITANTSSGNGSALRLRAYGTLELQGSLVSGNLAAGQPTDFYLYASGGVTGADNLVGVGAGEGDLPPPSGLIVSNNPGLAPLANNGGPTRTHALLANSLAIDKGNNSTNSTTDQRGLGFPRVTGARADIGAFERDPDRIFINGFD